MPSNNSCDQEIRPRPRSRQTGEVREVQAQSTSSLRKERLRRPSYFEQATPYSRPLRPNSSDTEHLAVYTHDYVHASYVGLYPKATTVSISNTIGLHSARSKWSCVVFIRRESNTPTPYKKSKKYHRISPYQSPKTPDLALLSDTPAPQ